LVVGFWAAADQGDRRRLQGFLEFLCCEAAAAGERFTGGGGGLDVLFCLCGG
jgi:hypothetical protein